MSPARPSPGAPRREPGAPSAGRRRPAAGSVRQSAARRGGPGARRTRPHPAGVPLLDVDAMLDTERIVVCCGSGGVGKTTMAAALALRAAERGRNVVVLTIDPARRLAQALGLTALDNTPREVAGVDGAAGGRLDAMMLDMKRTFDEIVLAHSTSERAEALLANPFYQSLSSSFAGTQEYMAMEKLGQLDATGTWDLIVVDTPPTRSALDFLDAPTRLGAFLDGRLLRLLLAPAKAGGRAYVKVLGAGLGVFTRVLTKVLGAQLLTDVSQFVAALETMFGGFRARAEETYRLLGDPGTSFIVVAAPEAAALREASYFVDRLDAEGMPLAGLVVNRMHHSDAEALNIERSLAAAENLEEHGEHPLAAAVLRIHADRVRLASREARLRERFTSAHPDTPIVEVEALSEDVHDLVGLREIGDALARDERLDRTA
ncbi:MULTISPECIES: ArsA family ATPase [Frankia]|uniref:Arsenite efflux ATP-binding protein ArsA n=2 Tax=Frankia casuarinae (strain DSM 45818 / CECT 9043 / HFP020203 / CcI3) TaxID=106370 RepID=Q2J517_FRACC|nr:arsenite efflux ATP-binding protein ArsA [Frankia casuarinae]